MTNEMKFIETHARSVVKTISWRIVITLSHIVNTFILTGSLMIGLQVAGLNAITATLVFWLHERLWNKTSLFRQEKEKIKFYDRRYRTLLKIITWRIAITVNNFLVGYIITGDLTLGAQFAMMALIINSTIFWFFDRVWNKISWGKKQEILAQ